MQTAPPQPPRDPRQPAGLQNAPRPACASSRCGAPRVDASCCGARPRHRHPPWPFAAGAWARRSNFSGERRVALPDWSLVFTGTLYLDLEELADIAGTPRRLQTSASDTDEDPSVRTSKMRLGLRSVRRLELASWRVVNAAFDASHKIFAAGMALATCAGPPH